MERRYTRKDDGMRSGREIVRKEMPGTNFWVNSYRINIPTLKNALVNLNELGVKIEENELCPICSLACLEVINCSISAMQLSFP